MHDILEWIQVFLQVAVPLGSWLCDLVVLLDTLDTPVQSVKAPDSFEETTMAATTTKTPSPKQLQARLAGDMGKLESQLRAANETCAKIKQTWNDLMQAQGATRPPAGKTVSDDDGDAD